MLETGVQASNSILAIGEQTMTHTVESQAHGTLPSYHIRGGTGVWQLRAAELWHYRDLLYFLIWRDIKVRYKQTLLGVLWVVLQPLAIALTLSLFLGRLAKVPSDGLPYPVFAYSAMVLWQLFSRALAGGSNSLVANERLITKVYFPRLLAPLSAVLASLLDFLIGLIVLGVFLVYYHLTPTPALLALPLPLFGTVLAATGAGLWFSAASVKYRDVRYTVDFLLQFWFLASPIAYPTHVVPARWQGWYGLNPMVGIVEAFRWTLSGSGSPPVSLFLLSLTTSSLLFLSGLYYFRKTEETFADFI